MTDKSTVIGVDVGGTFTDLFFLNDATGAIDVVKVPSTRGREADGFLDGLSRNQTDLAQVGTIVHGTSFFRLPPGSFVRRTGMAP